MGKRFAIFKAARANQRGREELGDYEGMFRSLLAQPKDHWDVFFVKEDQFPDQVDDFDGIVITGSPASAYDEEPWIRQLEDSIRIAYDQKVRILGTCFGHQVVANALGGRVEKNPKGWELGIRQLEFTAEARAVPEFSKVPHPMRILELHQDIVTKLPEGAVHLARSTNTEYEMYALGPHVFCLQGHPEFDNEQVRSIITERDWLPQDAVKIGLDSLTETPHRDALQTLLVDFLQGKSLAPSIPAIPKMV